MRVVTRVLGAATAAYSIAIMVRPKILAGPCGLTSATGEVPGEVRTLTAGIGARDTAIGLAMLCAPDGPAMRTAVASRVFADLSDAVVFGLTLPDPAARKKAAAFATAWAALCALSTHRRVP